MNKIKLTEEFNLAYRFITETDQNIFLTGKAGTGKTTFLKYLREHCSKKMVVAAPTGVAAINAGGVTLHSLFQLPFAPYIPAKDSANPSAINSHSLLSQIHYNKNKLDLLRGMELLIIDETSMVPSYTVDAIDTILRSVRRRYNEPFGGVQLLFIGDLHQLPPVVKREEWSFLREYYASIFFFDSLVLKENIPMMIELKEIFRQQDGSFIEILNGIRNNSLTEENFELLNSRLNRSFNSEEHEGYITLTTHNNQSDTINKRSLSDLPGLTRTFKATIQGTFPEHVYPAEEYLELKVGAQVMFLKNDTEEKRYFNGKIGVITVLEHDRIKVKCKGEEQEIEVSKYEWKNMNYSLNAETKEITEEELGSFVQYPLRLAWAITIHKSQGLTFDKLVVDAENAFANGQVYVALSRCTSLEGLVLTSPVNQKFLGAHQNLVEWRERVYDEKNLDFRFEQARQDFTRKELLKVFTLKNWYYSIKDLSDTMYKNKEQLPIEGFTWLEELKAKQKILDEVSTKFREQIDYLCAQNLEVEENAALQTRVKDAVNYFLPEIDAWKEKFHNHPFKIKTKKVARTIDIALEELNAVLHEVLGKVRFCKTGFVLSDYLKQLKTLAAPTEKMNSYFGERGANGSPIGSEHATLYNRLNELRKRIAKENSVGLTKVISNRALEKICTALPATKEVLLRIKGIGKGKMNMFGDEIASIVAAYCKEKNIEPGPITTESNSTLNDTAQESLRIFKTGKTITEIAKERNFVESTIEGHLAQAIAKGLLNITEIMPLAEADTIAAYFTPDGGPIQLSGIKERVPAGVSYGKLKMVLAWLQSRES